ncbi:MAG: hypothetical protein WAM84_08565 [Candidatus Cybelea sp.]
MVGVGVVIPRQLLAFLLGETTSDTTVILMARHWSLLAALVGGLLMYAGYHPEARLPAMIVGAAEKLVFGILVIASPLRRRRLTLTVVCADAVMGLLYLLILTQQRFS